MSSHKLTLRHIGNEATIILLLLINRLLQLRCVLVVCHNITQIRPASLVKIEG